MLSLVKTTINGKYDIILPEHRADRAEFHSEKGWERARIDSMVSKLKPGDTCLYIGAELGDLPALCAQTGANMVLVEANPTAWPSIKLIWEANNLPTPLNFCGFASDKTELTPPNPDQEHYGPDWWVMDGLWPKCAFNELVKEHGFSELATMADGTPQIKVDDMVEMYGLKIDLLTLDVEGSEGVVLRGAENTLKEQKPLIYLSGHPQFIKDHYKETLNQLRLWIKELGYSEELLASDHELHLLYKPL